MLSILAATPFARARSNAPAGALIARPAAATCTTSFTTRGQYGQVGMKLSNHIKVWPLGPQDGSTG